MPKSISFENADPIFTTMRLMGTYLPLEEERKEPFIWRKRRLIDTDQEYRNLYQSTIKEKKKPRKHCPFWIINDKSTPGKYA